MNIKVKKIVGFLLVVTLTLFVAFILKLKEPNISIIKDISEFHKIVGSISNKSVIVDLRDSKDFQNSNITKSINIQFDEDNESLLKAFRSQKLKNKDVYLICYSGNRAAKVFNILAEKGYKKIHYVAFGYEDYILRTENRNQNEQQNATAEAVAISYGEDFPEIDFYDVDKNKYSMSDFSGEYKIVAYLSDKCSSCIDSLNVLNRIRSLWRSEELQMILLWKEEIPTNITDKYGMTKNISYSLDNKYALSSSTPTTFILHNNKIMFNDRGILSSSVEKIITMPIIDKERLKSRADELIQNLFVGELKSKTLAFFTTTNCEECIGIGELINDTKVSEKYNLVQVVNTTDDIEGGFIDYGNIMGKIYEIPIYPTTICIETNGKRIVYGGVTKDKLKELLLD